MATQYMTKSRSMQPLPSSGLKKSLRDVQRLLSRENLAADIRQSQERKLKAIQMALEEKNIQEMERQHMHKYRMIRFFETKKALRRVERLRKQAKLSLKMDDQSLAEATQEAMNNLNYVRYFPKTLKYIALFPSSPISSAEVLQQQEQIRAHIAAKVAAGELENAYEILKRKSQPDMESAPQDKQGGSSRDETEEEDEEEDEPEEEEEEEDAEDEEEDGEDEEEDEVDEEGEDEDEDGEDEDEEGESENEEDEDEEDEDEDEEEESEDEEEESEDEAAEKKKKQKR